MQRFVADGIKECKEMILMIPSASVVHINKYAEYQGVYNATHPQKGKILSPVCPETCLCKVRSGFTLAYSVNIYIVFKIYENP